MPSKSGMRPSDVKPMKGQKPLLDNVPSLSSSEQQRIIDQTGLMQRVKQREAELLVKKQTGTAEYIWQALFLSIPFGFLVATFDVTVKVQYSEPWDYHSLIMKCIQSAPVLAPFIYLTNRYKSTRLAQSSMAVGALITGAFLMYTLRHSPSLGQMMRAPGLATVWIYFIVQLDLIPAVGTLIIVGLYWYFGLKQ